MFLRDWNSNWKFVVCWEMWASSRIVRGTNKINNCINNLVGFKLDHGHGRFLCSKRDVTFSCGMGPQRDVPWLYLCFCAITRLCRLIVSCNHTRSVSILACRREYIDTELQTYSEVATYYNPMHRGPHPIVAFMFIPPGADGYDVKLIRVCPQYDVKLM